MLDPNKHTNRNNSTDTQMIRNCNEETAQIYQHEMQRIESKWEKMWRKKKFRKLKIKEKPKR